MCNYGCPTHSPSIYEGEKAITILHGDLRRKCSHDIHTKKHSRWSELLVYHGLPTSEIFCQNYKMRKGFIQLLKINNYILLLFDIIVDNWLKKKKKIKLKQYGKPKKENVKKMIDQPSLTQSHGLLSLKCRIQVGLLQALYHAIGWLTPCTRTSLRSKVLQVSLEQCL